MEFEEVLEKRHSVRRFLRKEVEEGKVRGILHAASRAPSAGNLQAYKIFVVKNDGIRRRLADAAYGQEAVASAPVVLVFCADEQKSAARYAKRGESLYSVQDATIACAYAQLAATACGLASVWVGAFRDEEVARIIGAAAREVPVALLPLGYAAEKEEATAMAPIEEIATEM
ncbi:MAG: nitroreductase family protein [Candidatus Bilamarchaeaceae archaeon]